MLRRRSIVTIILCALMSVSAWSVTVDDLITIKKSCTITADEYTNNGTNDWIANTLRAENRIFTPTGNTVAQSKGKSTINGQSHLNCLRLKNVQNKLAFRVIDTCTVTFYTEIREERGLILSKQDRTGTSDPYYAKQPVNTPVWTIHLDAAGTYYLSGYGGDFFIAGLSIVLPDDGSMPEPPVVRYYDTNGTLLGRDTVEAGSKLTYKYTVADVTVPAGQAFRGWRNGDELKVNEGTTVTADISLFAKATDIELANIGTYYYYDLAKNSFYPEEHELLTVSDGMIAVRVAGNAVVNILTDGQPTTYRHEGAATTLTFTPCKGEHIRGVKVYNVATIPARNEAGYYVVSANDGAALMLLLEMAQDGDKIFLPNGTYDLGHMTLTPINTQISLIGQSMDGVLIQNHPLTSGMNNAETLVLKADNIYMQDLSIRCDVSYPTSIAHGVGIAVQVQGDKSIFKHVSLQGNQDTYYSNGSATQRGWFGDGRIEGTVDYICGGGDIWFENVLLYNNDRKNDDVIIAPATEPATRYGYVFNRCMIDGVTGQAGRWHLGRGWKNSPAGTWLNTTCRIAPSKQGYTHMNAGLKVRFHEYNTQRVDGTIFVAHNLDGLGYAADSDPIYLDGVGVYTYENVVLGADNWDAAAIAAQVTANPAAIDVDAAYLVEENGAFVAVVKGSELNAHYKGKTIRQANSRGGFGKAVRY
jgi:Pectin methylesterase